jgi:hypothetical protein
MKFEAVSDKGMHLNLLLEATKGRFKSLAQRLNIHLLSENFSMKFEAVIQKAESACFDMLER